MDKVRRDKRKEVHARLDFGEGSRKRRTIEGSHYSSARTLSARPERLKVRDRLRYNDRHVLDRLGHRRWSAFDRLSETYSPSTTKSRPDRTSSRDRSRGRRRPHRRDASNGDRPESKDYFRGVGESYDKSHSSYGTGINHGYRYRDRDRSRHTKRGRDSESPLSSVSKSDSSDGGHWKSKSKRHKPTDEDDLTMPWMCEEVDPFTPRIRNFKSSPKEVRQRSCRIHNIKQKDRETIEDFMERFKVETERMKGAPECMRIFGFMQGVNNLKLTKRLNKHVPKTMEEMMITTIAFIRGEAIAASKKKGHTSWRTQDQSKRKTSEKRSDFRCQSREGRGSSRFTPLRRTPKEILTVEAGKFQPSPPMVTPVEKRSSNKFYDFHNDKGHSTDECMQLKKHIEEFVRAGKLSHLIKEIEHGRDQSKVRKKEAPAKDKPTTIYMIQSWQSMTRQKVTQSFERVRKITFPSLATSSGTEGPLVIEAEICGHMIHCMYVDGGSSTEVLYEHCFNMLRPEVKNQMVPVTTSLTGFSGETIWPLGLLRILVTIGDADHYTRAWMNFMIVRMLKFLADGGIVTIRSTILIPSECATVITSSKEIPKEAGVRHENFKVAVHPNFPDQEPSDMTGVPRSVAEHRLNIREGYSPVRQKKKGQAPKRAKAIQVKVQKLVEARIIREVYYHDWFSNLVMVKKHNGSWRMCVDFTDLNKACPQDCYPLSKIDWKVESLCGYPFKCFLDAYKGYHQIQLAESDEEKTAFHASQGVYCYTKMSFGLKNAGATYQRLVDKAFDSQIGQNIEVYIDDLVIKSHTEAEMLRDIGETFRTLRKINMKLNPKNVRLGQWKQCLGIHDYPGRDKTVRIRIFR
nr:reverse transcriptase domain-containing protein [Tanacetum cinerariifolium]